MQDETLACSFSHAKHSMYRAFDAVFGAVERSASPDVVVQLVKTKCLPVLCYGIEVCPANKYAIRALQYVVDNCFRKIFDMKLKEAVKECMREFNVSTVNDVIDAKKRKFLAKYSVSENSLYQVFACVGNLRLYSLCYPFVLYCYLVFSFFFLFSFCFCTTSLVR